MPIRVQVGDKVVEFPDGTSEDVMRGALSKLNSSPYTASAADMLTHAHPNEAAMPGETSAHPYTVGSDPSIIRGMTSMGSGMANPKGVGDVASLLLPSDLGFGGGAKFIGELASRSGQALKGAVAETKGVGSAATIPFRAFRKFKDALPSANEAAADKFIAPTRGTPYTPAEPVINAGADVIDRNMPAVRRATVPKPPAAKAPTLDEALQTALEENMGGQPASVSSASVDAAPILKGDQKPKVGKRPGGYTTENPPKPAYGAAPAPSGKSAKLADTSAGTDSLDELLTALHGEEPINVNPAGHGTMPAEKPHFNASEVARIQERTGGQMLPDSAMADAAAILRRLKGSRDAGAVMFPELPSSARGDLVKKLAPGPSQVPLEAESRINAAAQKAKGDIDLPSLLMAMLAGGGGALASRQTAPNFSGLPE